MANSVGNICVKFSEKTGRTRLDDIDFSCLVSILKERVSTAIGLPPSELLMVYCGRLLRDTESLKSYGLETGCTVHALRKKTQQQATQAEPLDDVAIRQLMTALHAALLNPSHRQALHKILTNTETIDNIIAATPGLAADHVAVSMLRDPELLMQIADAENVRRIVRAHPAIGHAVMHVAATVSEEGVQSDRARGPDAEQGSQLPALSDDEMDTSSDAQGSSRPQLITQAQLSAALAAAGVGNTAGSSAGAYTQNTFRPYNVPLTQASASTTSQPSTSTTAPSQAGQSASPRVRGQPAGGVITADLFSQAIAHALQQQQQQQQQQQASTAGTNPSRPARDRADATTLTPEQLQVQLQQLRSMGITDDTVSLQALQATGGNVQAALDLIFEGRL